MTLIALVPLGNVPVLISDVVLSAKFTPKQLHLPTQGAVVPQHRTVAQPVGVSRKIVWKDRNSIIAFSGPYREALRLRKRVSSLQDRSPKRIVQELTNARLRSLPGLSIVGMVRDRDGWFGFGSGPDAWSHASPDGTIHVAGSGRYGLLSLLSSLSRTGGFLSRASVLHAALFLGDSLCNFSQSQLAGGAYEAWYPCNGKIVPLANHNIVLGVGRANTVHFSILHNIRYYKGWLCARTVALCSGQGGDLALAKGTTHVISYPNVHLPRSHRKRIAEQPFLQETPLQTTGLAVFDEDERLKGTLFMGGGKSSSNSIFLHEHRGGVLVTVPHSFLASYRAGIGRILTS